MSRGLSMDRAGVFPCNVPLVVNRLAGALGACCMLAAPAAAGIDPVSGIDFVTIGAPGNQPWMGATPHIPGDMAIGRGGVDYEYRIGRFEVTTAQWTEFFNAAFDRPASDRIPWLIPPTFWGAQSTAPNTPGGLRWTVPAGNEMRPVGNISWRMAAIYCNWLHNGKSTDRSAFMNGAYDVSQFSGFTHFTDQFTHNPDAQYWIPTWDEWLKAAHYDPDKNGLGEGGWWEYSNGTDEPLIPGPPGVGEANFGFIDGTQFMIPLGAYPDTQTPWGLLDAAGGTAEWTEGIVFGSQDSRVRVYEGSYWSSATGNSINDAIFAAGGTTFPSTDFLDLGFRLAMAVPSPHTAFVLTGAGIFFAQRRRRHEHARAVSTGGDRDH